MDPDFRPRIIILTIFTLLFLLMGLILYMMYDSAKYDLYGKGRCTIVNADVNKTCLANSCDYIGFITIQYVGKFKTIDNTLQMLDGNVENTVRMKLYKEYPIGKIIICYYPKKLNYPLRIDLYMTSQNVFFYIFGISFFVTAGIAFIFIVINIIRHYHRMRIEQQNGVRL
jgi:hypothetical protein